MYRNDIPSMMVKLGMITPVPSFGRTLKIWNTEVNKYNSNKPIINGGIDIPTCVIASTNFVRNDFLRYAQ